MNLNLHWGRTLQNKAVQLRHRSQYNLTNSAFPFNYSDTSAIYPWRINSSRSGNGSILHAENQFLKKSKILTDLIDNTVKSHSFTTVVTISSIFLFLTMTITAAVLVFCKKKNTVFSLQKSEQEDDGEYELDDMPTDVEYTETDYNTESDTESIKHKRSPANLKRMAERRTQRIQQRESSVAMGFLEGESSTASSRRPLVEDMGVQIESEADDSPLPVRHVCRCGADPRGAYQRMVVTAILEKPHSQGGAGGGRGVGSGGGGGGGGSENGDSDTELRTKYIEKLRKHYYALAQTASSDIESENEGCPISKPPIINVTYVDDPPAYDCLDYKLPKSDKLPDVSVEVQDYKPPQSPAFSVVDVHRADSPVDYAYSTPDKKSDIPIMFVELPAPREKKEPPDGASVVFVELPPKPTQQQQQSESCDKKNGAVRISSTAVVTNNGDTDVCLSGTASPKSDSGLSYPRMQLCSGSEGFPSMPLVPGSEGYAVPTLAIIPPTPMSDSRPEDSVLLTYVDEEEESDYNEDEQTCKCLIEDSTSR